jgi:hypothetical protein
LTENGEVAEVSVRDRSRDPDFCGLIHKEFTPTLFPVTGDKPNPCEILEPVGAGGMGVL